MAKLLLLLALSVDAALAYGQPPPSNPYSGYSAPPPPSYASPGYATPQSGNSYGNPQPYETKNSQCLHELCHWNKVEYTGLLNVPDRWDHSRLDIGAYHNPYHPIPWAIAIQDDGYGEHKIFVTIPRRHTGIPATLGYFNLRDVRGGQCPPVKPWPNAEVNDLKSDCEKDGYRIVSIWRPEIDKCGRLWAIDTGVLDLPDNKPYVVQPPTLKVWDTKSGELLKEIFIPAHIAKDARGLTYVYSDVEKGYCDSGYGYIPDNKNNQIIVVDIKSRVKSHIKLFGAIRAGLALNSGNLFVNGNRYDISNGVWDIVLSLDQRYIYYQATASLDAWAIPVEQARNESLCASRDLDVTYLGRRSKRGQTVSQWDDTDDKVIWSLQSQQNSLSCWNPKNSLISDTIAVVDKNPELNVFPSDFWVHDKDIYVLSNNLPEIDNFGLDPSKKNFVILVGNKKQCLANAPQCTGDVSPYQTSEPYKSSYPEPESYKSNYPESAPYKPGHQNPEPYKSRVHDPEPYKQNAGYPESEPYKPSYSESAPYKPSHQNPEPYKSRVHDPEPYRPSSGYAEPEPYKSNYQNPQSYKQSVHDPETYKRSHEAPKSYKSNCGESQYKK